MHWSSYTCLPRHQRSPLRPLPPAARPVPSHLQLPCPSCSVAVRVATLRSQRWRAAALARLVCTAFAALDTPLHTASHAVHALFQMLRAAGRSVVNSVSRTPPMAVRLRARLVGKQRRCLSWL